MNTQNALMMLTAQTSLHAGAGQSVAGIDLPIQREAHNNWPCVFGSAVKGAMRARAEAGGDNARVVDLFGPAPDAERGESNETHAGALMVGDARLLLLPVRSLQSCFKWVSCPAALRRFRRDCERLGVPAGNWSVPGIEGTSALQHAAGEQLFLEEYRLSPRKDDVVAAIAGTLAQLGGAGLDEEDLRGRLVIVSDDIFSYLATNATAVNAHIALDSKTKSVVDRALWYEETLPPETVLYVALAATASRRSDARMSAADVMSALREQVFPPDRSWLQLGGNETTGMGWCRVNLTSGKPRGHRPWRSRKSCRRWSKNGLPMRWSRSTPSAGRTSPGKWNCGGM